MNRRILAAILLFLMAMSVLPLGALGKTTTPYIEIQEPKDGTTVGTETTLVVVAEGYDLNNPFVTIQGEGIGVEFPLEDCVFSQQVETSDNLIYGPEKMYCKTKINLNAFEGEKIKLSVSVRENSGHLVDSVGLFVSGQSA